MGDPRTVVSRDEIRDSEALVRSAVVRLEELVAKADRQVAALNLPSAPPELVRAARDTVTELHQVSQDLEKVRRRLSVLGRTEEFLDGGFLDSVAVDG